MEQLIAEERKRVMEERAAAKADKAQDSDEDGEEPLFHLRLDMLRRDIRHLMSTEQKEQIQVKMEESKKKEEEKK